MSVVRRRTERASEGGKAERAARTRTAMRAETAPQTIHSSARPEVPFDQFIQGFKAFPRARPSWLCLVLPPFSFFLPTLGPYSRLHPLPLPFDAATPVQRSAGVLMLSSVT